VHIPAFSIALKPSRRFRYFLLLLHFLIIISICFLTLPGWQVLLFSTLILCHCHYAVQRYAWSQQPRWVQRLSYRDGYWYLHTKCGAEHAVELSQSTVWRWLLVMNFKPLDSAPAIALSIFADSVAQDDRPLLRRLRLMLRQLPVYVGDNS
jgi:hypothetical protein